MGFFDAFKDTLQLAKNTFVVIGKNPAILKPTMKQVWIGAIVYFLVIASIFAIAFPYNVLPIIAAIVIFGCIIYLVFIFPFVKIHYKAAQCWMVYRTFAGKPVTYEEGLQRAKINKKDIILLGVFDILLRALANKLKQGTRKDGLWIILDIIMKIAGKVVEEGWDLIGHYLLPASIIKEQSVMEALPEKQVTMLYCEMEPKQREFYEYWREKFREEIKDTIRTQGFMQSRMKILAGLTKLRQICNHPLLVDESFTGESGKLNLLLKI